MAEERRYRFHPREQRGLLLGFGPGPLALVAAGGVAALLVLRSVHGAAGLGLAMAVGAASLVVSRAPLAGRPMLDWARPLVSLVVRRRVRVQPAGRIPPSLVSGLSLLRDAGSLAEPPIGVIRDARQGTWGAALPVTGPTLSLLDAEDKHRRLEAWAGVLAGTARSGSAVHRLQWVERTVLGEPGGMHDRLIARIDASGPPGAAADYGRLVRKAEAGSVSHELLVVVSVRRSYRSGGHARAFGRGSGAAVGMLRRELRLLSGALTRAGLSPGEPLDLDSLAGALRGGLVPVAAERGSPRAEAGAWPSATEEAWSWVRADGRFHATYWVAEWPRVDVGPEFLSPLLASQAARVVSLTMAPVEPSRSVREAESAVTADLADRELRERAGFSPTARRAKESHGALQREAELADGHAEMRFSGYVSVNATSEEELDAACAALEQLARQSHLELRRLYGQQREALSWVLPLGRGLR